DEEVYQRLMRLRWVGIDHSTFARAAGQYRWEYGVSEVGYKYHMNDIIAAIGLEHLKRVDEWNGRRRQIVETYRTELSTLGPDKLRFVERTEGAVSANHLCVVRVNKRNEVVRMLAERGISVGVHYKPNHLYPPYATARRGRLDVTEQAYSEILSLPLHLFLTDDDVQKVCDALRTIILGQG
ncbi:MAG TPA: DegT/DnrJ/EryC1/StrS family aminotransferase, partial [Blastocatellia bacterium]|nr:DegT/DnrJ/EryC1/StrS family aminotransferase [Blastocatellia bacterium]